MVSKNEVFDDIRLARAVEKTDVLICIGDELLRKLEVFHKGIKQRLSDLSDAIEFAGVEDNLDSCSATLDEYESYLHKGIESIYLTATQPLSGELAVIEKNQRESAHMFGIHAELINGNLIVRMPMLGSMYRRRSDGSRPYGHMFAVEVESVVRELITTLDQEVIEKFQKKTLIYCFVYSQEDRYVLDSDNHDSKTITDAVCAPFLSTDSGCSTMFCYRTIITDSLQPGTYIVLSPGMGSIPDLDILSSFGTEVDKHDNNTEDPI